MLRNLDDPSKYQSAEFAGIAIDELTKNTFETFEILRGSLRWPGISWRPFLAATNPGGIGHLWVKALWVDRSFTGFPQLKDRAKDFAFVQALPHVTRYIALFAFDVRVQFLSMMCKPQPIVDNFSIFLSDTVVGSGLLLAQGPTLQRLVDGLLRHPRWPFQPLQTARHPACARSLWKSSRPTPTSHVRSSRKRASRS